MKRGALAVVAVLALAACGDGSARLSKGQYQARLHAAFVAAQSAESGAQRDGSDQVKVLKGVAATYSGLASALRGLRAPAGVQTLNDQLVAGASARARALDSLVAKLERMPQVAVNRVLAEFDATQVAGQRQLDEAVAALEAKGYRFRPSEGT
jgi:hypothetical protein